MAHENEFVDYTGLEVVACCVNSKFGSKAVMPNDANDNAIAVYTGDTCGCFIKGHTYQYCLACTCWTDLSPAITVDQSYNASSCNPQSGIAVAEAINTLPVKSIGKAKAQYDNTRWQCVNWNQQYIDGFNVWTDGCCTYYSDRDMQFVLNKSTGCWDEKTWCDYLDMTYEIEGKNIWTDGCCVYLNGNTCRVLKIANSCWDYKNWNCNIQCGCDVWTDGNCVFYDHCTCHYVLNKSTGCWSDNNTNSTGNGVTCGNNIWTDGINIYYNSSSTSCVYVASSNTWSCKTWNCSIPDGSCIWTDGKNIYAGDCHLKLNRATGCWEYVNDAFMQVPGCSVWTDGACTYYSGNGFNCVLTHNVVQVNAKPSM